MSDSTEEWICPSLLIRLPEGTRRVLDADEEISDLYMTLANLPSETGLGYLDTTKATLELEMELISPVTPSEPSSPPLSPPSAQGQTKKRREKHHTRKKPAQQTKTIGIEVHQDLGSLRNRKGDTGSVLWRSSWFLAKHLLTQHYFSSSPDDGLLDRDALRQGSVIELGAGTGVLAVLLAGLCGSYTATDLYDSLKLVKRNVEANRVGHDVSRLRLEEMDWIEVSRSFNLNRDRPWATSQQAERYDLVLSVDSIYNEYLVKPFVDTLASLCIQGSSTVVLVIVELRSADVLTVFLEEWLRNGDWVIVRLPSAALGMWGASPGRWVGWHEPVEPPLPGHGYILEKRHSDMNALLTLVGLLTAPVHDD